uniref:Metalloendopeptidase n=1 Tax=Strongyloides papillosus TaxID=174720 RepID=A0A0N5BGL3_STREA
MKKAVFMFTYNENNNIYKRDIFEYKDSLWKIPIKYQIRDGLKNSVIIEALNEIENNTCIKFEEYDLFKYNIQGILFENSRVCSSQVGVAYQNSRQTVRLTYECSERKGYVLHEVGHAIGLLHEHCRTDRDKFVTIDFNNIERAAFVNFEIPKSLYYKNCSTSYDYGSLMHYNPYEFAYYPWRQVLSSKTHKAYDRMMGQRLYMTFNDYKKINFVYCYNRSRTKEICEGKTKEIECHIADTVIIKTPVGASVLLDIQVIYVGK